MATYEQLAHQLARLIGEAGVRAIHARAVHLTQKEFPWFTAAQPTGNFPLTIQPLLAALEHQQPAVILLTAEALVANFTDLLVTLVGEQLTTRLLHEVWPGGLAAATAMETTE